MGSDRPAEIVQELKVSPEELDLILGGNATRLCGLELSNGESTS